MINPKDSYQQTAPLQYINEKNTLGKIGAYVKHWGSSALISGGNKALNSSMDLIVSSLNNHGVTWYKHKFIGECSTRNIQLITKKIEEKNVDMIIGVGGGKSIDSAKVAAEKANCKMIAIPTIAATCAATSSISIIYNDDGTFNKTYYLREHPSLVIIEPDIIAKAPVKYLKSGIIDSISKWYEGKSVMEGLDNPDIFSLSAINLAKLLKEQLFKSSYKAIEQCHKKYC